MVLSHGDSEKVGELQSQLDTQTGQLKVAQQNLIDTEGRLRDVEGEKQRLQNQLSDVASKLEQSEANLAAAKKSSEMGSGNAGELALSSPELEEAKANVTQMNEKVKELTYNLETVNNTLTQREDQLRQSKLALENVQVENGNLKTALEKAKQDMAASAPAPAPAPVGALKVSPREEDYRDFVSSKGSVSKMAFIRWEGEDIIVRSFANKRLYRLTLQRFSKADQNYLLERK